MMCIVLKQGDPKRLLDPVDKRTTMSTHVDTLFVRQVLQRRNHVVGAGGDSDETTKRTAARTEENTGAM